MDKKLPTVGTVAGMTALETGREIQAGRMSTVEALQSVLDRVDETGPLTNSYVHIDRDDAMESAATAQKQIDYARAEGTVQALSPLAGVPVALKDNLCVRGQLTTCGSRILEGHRPIYDATAVRKLRNAGVVLIGKTNMDEFAMGSTTETSCFPVTANPQDLARSPGGSSGGSAAAVASHEAFAALGSDTGGSIRQPASFCGVVGLKPTYGAVSRYGLVAFASSLDQIGPIGRTVADCARLFEIVAGLDPKDSTSMECAHAPFKMPDPDSSTPLRGMRIGIPDEYFGDGLDPSVRERVTDAAATMEKLGATCERFSLPVLAHGVPAYYILACAEASSNLARYDGIKYGFRADGAEDLADLYVRTRSQGFGLEAKRRIMLGNFVLSSGYYDAYYSKAMQVRTKVRLGLDEAFDRFDMLLGPVSPSTAPLLGESLQDPLKMYLGDVYTVAANLAGLPALSVPCGDDDAGLPVGLQLIGPRCGDIALLAAAHHFERAVTI